MGSVDNISYDLCDYGNDNTEHLFFSCSYSTQVWQKILNWQATGWAEEQSGINFTAGKLPEAEESKIALPASVYYIWQERNHRILQKKAEAVKF